MPSLQPLRIGVVGAGFAGCAAALNLAQRGVKVTLIEAAPTPGPVGQGIGLQPVGMSALHRMQQPGLLEDVLAHGARVDGIHTWSLRGGEPSTVLDVEYARFDPRMFGLGLGRGVLFSALYERACAEDAVEVHVGTAVGGLRESDEGVEVLRQEGGSLGLYDCVVLADGARSALRGTHGMPSVVRRYPYGALFALLPDPEGVTDHWLTQVHAGPGASRTLGFLPTGRAWGAPAAAKQATLYYSMRLDDPRVAGCLEPAAQDDSGTACGGNALPDAFDVVGFRAECEELMPGASAVLRHLTHASQLQLGSYADVLMPWFSSGRVVCIGDHAHATSPQLGQGANLALVDALALADALAARPPPPGAAAEARRGAVCAALVAYTRARRLRVHFYQLQSRLLTPLFASRSELVAAARDAAFPLACAWGPTRRYATAVLCGAQAVRPWATLPEAEWATFLAAAAPPPDDAAALGHGASPEQRHARLAAMTPPRAPPRPGSTNVFARILRGEAPAEVVEDGEELFCFHDANPAAERHLLVIPREFIRDASTLRPTDAPLVRRMRAKAVQLTRAAVGKGFDEEQLLLGFHWPPAYSVPWLHLHALYPRASLRRRWKYTAVSFKSPEWVLERLERQALTFRPPKER